MFQTEADSLAGAVIQLLDGRSYLGFRHLPEVGPLGEVLPDQAIGVLVRPSLAGAEGVTEVGRC